MTFGLEEWVEGGSRDPAADPNTPSGTPTEKVLPLPHCFDKEGNLSCPPPTIIVSDESYNTSSSYSYLLLLRAYLHTLTYESDTWAWGYGKISLSISLFSQHPNPPLLPLIRNIHINVIHTVYHFRVLFIDPFIPPLTGTCHRDGAEKRRSINYNGK